MFFNTELFPFFFSHHRRTCRGRRYWSVCGFWKQEDYGNLRYSGKISAQSQAVLDRTLHTSGYSIGTMIRNILTWFFFLSNHVTCRIHRENHSLRSKRYYSPLLRRPLAGWTVFFFGFTHRPQSPCTDTGPPLHKRSVFLSHSLLFYPLYSLALGAKNRLTFQTTYFRNLIVSSETATDNEKGKSVTILNLVFVWCEEYRSRSVLTAKVDYSRRAVCSTQWKWKVLLEYWVGMLHELLERFKLYILFYIPHFIRVIHTYTVVLKRWLIQRLKPNFRRNIVLAYTTGFI